MGAQQHRTALGALSRESRHPLLPALAAQCISLVVVGVPVLAFFPALLAHPLTVALLQGLVAALLARWMRAPPWWLVIHLGFMPLAVVVRWLDLPGRLWPFGLLLLVLVFWRNDRNRVPLYLSSRQSAERLLQMLPDRPCRVLDLGCGDGRLLRYLARRRPDCRFVGVEYAPLPWLWARLAGASLGNLEILRRDFWNLPLSDYDLVYAFLSPAPMSRLWLKACREMRPGATLVSNSFPVPDTGEDARIAVNDRSMTYFYVYRPGGPRSTIAAT